MIVRDRERAARLVTLLGAIVAFDRDALVALRRAAPPGEPDAGWREVLLMAHLFCGVPRTLSALEVLAGAGGLGAPTDAELVDPTPDSEAESALSARSATERGAELFDRIYGSGADAVRSALRAYHPTLATWIAEHAYGRVLSRPGLDAATRELCAVAALAITAHERQLAGHARGAVRCGAAREEVAAALTLVERWTPPSFRQRARDLAAEFAR